MLCATTLALYEKLYGDCELGILFMRKNRYNEVDDANGNDTVDIRNDIGTLGVCLDENTLKAMSTHPDKDYYSSIDFIMTYKMGLDHKDENGVPRSKEQVVISAYMLHKEEKAGNLKNTSMYVQDKDDICKAGETNDKKYVTVSYESVYGVLQAQMNPGEEGHTEASN